MPLPPAPAKRAALLDPAAYEVKAKKKPKAIAPVAVVSAAAAATPAASAAPVAALPAKGKAAAPASAPMASPAASRTKASGKVAGSAAPALKKKLKSQPQAQAGRLFVLDTNVLLHDPTSLFRFEEHDIYLPMIVLEELDGHKKGATEVARNARQISRTLDQLAAGGQDIAHGLPLNATGHSTATGRLFFQTVPLSGDLPAALPQGKADNQILGVVAALQAVVQGKSSFTTAKEAVLVSKDINMRVKARALCLPAEDYQNDKVLEDGDVLFSGALALPADFWAKQGKNVESWNQDGFAWYKVAGSFVADWTINQFVYLEADGEKPFYARVVELRGDSAVLKTLRDFTHSKNNAWGITARNREQNFALNLLTDPDIDLVTMAGNAGTGKTLLTLAAGLSQVLDSRRYSEIVMTRATVNVGDDIGFLPGTEEEKMGPWMGALDDNLEFLAKNDTGSGGAGEWGRAATNDLIRAKIKIKSLNFMRGRTFINKFLIIDEAQNLTPKQIKTLITRAGPGTKIVCMGNLAQIDTPYLTEGSSGLTYLIDRFKGWTHSGHITLARGERSRLADYASDIL
ncbi:MAG: PhoH family protein [Brachymonas sp.]|jgi:PhoH-like ATPase